MTSPNPTSIRIDAVTDAEIDDIVQETGARRSLVLRALIVIACEHREEVVARIRSQL